MKSRHNAIHRHTSIAASTNAVTTAPHGSEREQEQKPGKRPPSIEAPRTRSALVPTRTNPVGCALVKSGRARVQLLHTLEGRFMDPRRASGGRTHTLHLLPCTTLASPHSPPRSVCWPPAVFAYAYAYAYAREAPTTTMDWYESPCAAF